MKLEQLGSLETQLHAVHGFTEWLSSIPPEQQTGDEELNDQLRQFLGFYEKELERQIDFLPATHDWFDVIAVQSILGPLLKDSLLEQHPELAVYQPFDEPTTVHEMALRLIHDALVLFADGQREMGTYLKQPVAPGVLDGLIERVLTYSAVEADRAL